MRLIFTAMLVCFAHVCAATAGIDARFAYRITGDKIAAPVQVFDSKGKTYLQLRDVGIPPAVFGEDGTPISYFIQKPYLVLWDVYPGLILRYGHSEARIQNAGYIKRINGSEVKGEFNGSLLFSNAANPVPSMTPNQRAAKIVHSAVTGKFIVNDDDDTDDNDTRNESDKNRKDETDKRIEQTVELVFSGKKLRPLQVVKLSALVKSIGRDGIYVVAYKRSAISEENGLHVKKRLVSLGVHAKNVTLQNRQGIDDELLVSITGDKK